MAAIGSSPFVYQKVRNHRADRLALRSLDLAQGDQLEAAREAAEAAFNLVPDAPASLRARARCAKTATDAFFFAEALLGTGAATPADVRHYLEICLSLNFAAGIELSLQQLLEAEPDEPQNWLLAGRFNLLRARHQIALHCAGRALELDAESRPARLLAAEIALFSSEPSYRDAATTTLKKIIAENATDRASLMAQVALLPGSASSLIAHPLATANQRLLAATHQLEASGEELGRRRIIAETTDRHGADDLPQLAHWLNINQLATETLRLINYETARTSTQLFTPWCHAMNACGRSDELIAIIEDSQNHSEIPLPSDGLEFVLVDAFEASGRPTIADLHWSKILRDTRSGNRMGKLLKVATWAERHSYHDRAIGLYRTLLSESPDNRPHWYDRITQLARQSNQLPLLREITAELHAIAPENIVYQHNLAYLSALSGEDLEQASEILTGLIESLPQAGSARCALALLRKHQGDDAATLAQLEKIRPANLDPTSKFIYLTLSGQRAPVQRSITPFELEALASVRSDDGASLTPAH